MSNREDLFDTMMKRADKMFSRFDKLTNGLFADGIFRTSTTETFPAFTTPKEDVNPPMEYKVVPVHDLNPQGRNFGGPVPMTVELNKLGADGWDLVHYDGGNAIFSRFVE
jgi:hypothetical protein